MVDGDVDPLELEVPAVTRLDPSTAFDMRAERPTALPAAADTRLPSSEPLFTFACTAVGWYYLAALTDPSWMDRFPHPEYGNTLTVRQTTSRLARHLHPDRRRTPRRPRHRS